MADSPDRKAPAFSSAGGGTAQPARSPATSTPPRRPRSLRRTSHMDMTPQGSSSLAGLSLRGAARDLLTLTEDGHRLVGEATVAAELGEGRLLRSIACDPAVPLQGLLEQSVGSGFRAMLDAAVPDHRRRHTPLYLLLDELPVASLIAGYADLYLRDPDEPAAQSGSAARQVRSDICAGWAADATMMQAIARDGRIPIPVGPPAPPLEPATDPLAWHAIAPLGKGSMRRRRRIDVTHGEPLQVDAAFRDTHVGPDGQETVLHEYSLTATVDPKRRVVLSCSARPRVLPWLECPAAAASAERLVGKRVGELKSVVRQEFRGTSTCTHLNDLLRSLANVEPMADQLATTFGTPTQ